LLNLGSAIICDFDGVIADSEVLANAVLAEFVTELGVPTTVARTLARFRQDLAPIAGVREFIAKFVASPRCIASSSTPQRLAVSLEILEMTELFEGRVFSALNVVRGKPHPDIFLHAAAAIGVSPRDCIIIEDSASGVIAGREAGSTVIGLLAAGHIPDGHGARPKDVGAHYLAASYVEVERIVRDLLSR
jgi:HAD superfamily hydrolase (TIGR01509 family)